MDERQVGEETTVLQEQLKSAVYLLQRCGECYSIEGAPVRPGIATVSQPAACLLDAIIAEKGSQLVEGVVRGQGASDPCPTGFLQDRRPVPQPWATWAPDEFAL